MRFFVYDSSRCSSLHLPHCSFNMTLVKDKYERPRSHISNHRGMVGHTELVISASLTLGRSIAIALVDITRNWMPASNPLCMVILSSHQGTSTSPSSITSRLLATLDPFELIASTALV